MASAASELRDNFSALHRAPRGTSLDHDWKLWKSLFKNLDGKKGLQVSNRNTKLPAGYDELAEAVMSAAEELTGGTAAQVVW